MCRSCPPRAAGCRAGRERSCEILHARGDEERLPASGPKSALSGDGSAPTSARPSPGQAEPHVRGCRRTPGAPAGDQHTGWRETARHRRPAGPGTPAAAVPRRITVARGNPVLRPPTPARRRQHGPDLSESRGGTSARSRAVGVSRGGGPVCRRWAGASVVRPRSMRWPAGSWR